ncbi:MAG: cysteine--tRNA ligase [Candidatus Brennerbacteria bacterium]
MKIFNTLTRRKETFRPLHKKTVGLYTCGPTVYNYAHIGNLRTYLFEDVLKRVLLREHFKVTHVMNITDVEDKIIARARRENKNIRAVTAPFTKAFHKDLKKLNIGRANHYPAATSHIKPIITLITKLAARGIAYRGEDGSVYFNIRKFKSYGALSRLALRTIKQGARVSSDEYAKEDAQDFVLWKAAKPGEPSWPSPWGRGRPGWHIECSAMSMKYLGTTVDIHAGAVDLIFPHHENEIAQSEAATGKPFVKYFVHGEHLLVDGKKMSKSLGNIYTLRDLAARGEDPLAYRYFVLGAHYRTQLNFTWDALHAAAQAFGKLRRAVAALKGSGTHTPHTMSTQVRSYTKRFNNALADDLNTARALACLWDTVNSTKLAPREKLSLLLSYDEVLGLGLKDVKKPRTIPAEIRKLASERELCRRNKQFALSDTLRTRIGALGYTVDDTPQGPIITPHATGKKNKTSSARS